MPKNLDWEISNIETDNPHGQTVEHILHSAVSDVSLSQAFEPIVIECIDKATSLLVENITDNSRYFMFEWHPTKQELTILITDDSKINDSAHIVRCRFAVPVSDIAEQGQANSNILSQPIHKNLSSSIKECIHNYMITCNEFMQYSLIAVFHCSNRENTELV